MTGSATLIVVGFNGDQWLPDCLRTLSESSSSKFHLCLVDNHNNPGLDRQALDAFEAIVLKTPRPMGFAEANNFALINTPSIRDFIIFLNQDTLSSKGGFASCVEMMQAQPGIGALTPMTKSYDWNGWDPYFLECAEKSPAFKRAFREGNELKPFYEVPVIPAAAMVVRRDVLMETGPFDPIYGSYYEDYDLCRRIRAAGYKVGVCTGANVAHYSGSATQTPADRRRRAYWVTRNRVILRQRQGKRLRTLLKYALMDFPRGLGRSLLRRPSAKPLGAFLRAHLSLLLLLPRLLWERYDRKKWQGYLNRLGWPGILSH